VEIDADRVRGVEEGLKSGAEVITAKKKSGPARLEWKI
jgi:hypothetical protein